MPSDQEMNAVLSAYGITSSGGGINWANIMGGIIFGIIGFCAFNYGRKEKAYKPLAIGLVLMIYPYFVPNTILLFAIGIGGTSLLYFWRD